MFTNCMYLYFLIKYLFKNPSTLSMTTEQTPICWWRPPVATESPRRSLVSGLWVKPLFLVLCVLMNIEHIENTLKPTCEWFVNVYIMFYCTVRIAHLCDIWLADYRCRSKCSYICLLIIINTLLINAKYLKYLKFTKLHSPTVSCCVFLDGYRLIQVSALLRNDAALMSYGLD